MKKSWHTGTFQNKERVWKHEKSALEERKKLQELQKELEQERAVQELQRLQAEAGGKKRQDRVDWMYAAPAEGNGPNAEELEAYLLGKKRVDKLLKGNEEKLMAAPSASAPGGSFTAIQNANTSRDTAAKIREDPLLAIKRQEQLQYEKMLKNPQRLKELRDRQLGAGASSHGRDSKRSKKDETKEEHRARKEAKVSRHLGHDEAIRDERSRHHRDNYDRRGGDEREDSQQRHRSSSDYSYRRYDEPRRERDRSRSPRRDLARIENSDARRHVKTQDYTRQERSEGSYRGEREPRPYDSRSNSSAPLRGASLSGYKNEQVSPRHPRDHDHLRSHSHPNDRRSHDLPSRDYPRNGSPASAPSVPVKVESQSSVDEQAARRRAVEERLAAMQASAASLSATRAIRVKEEDAADELEQRTEMQKQIRSGGVGPKFLREQEKQVFGGGMDLAERMKRSGKVGMAGE